MKTTESNTKTLAIVLTALFFMALGGIVYMHDTNTSLETLLDNNRLKSETLLSEKLMLDKEIKDLRADINAQKGKSKALDAALSKAQMALEQKERELRNRSKNEVKAKDLDELRKIKTQLEAEKNELYSNLNQVLAEKDRLIEALAAANSQNKSLNDKVSFMEALAINNMRVDATKRNEKLTVVARKTRQLNMAFDLPQHLANDVQFKLRTPSGAMIDHTDAALSWHEVIGQQGEYTASIELMQPGDLKVSKRMEMRYEPKDRLQRGLYTIDVYNGKTYVASCQVRLR